MYVGQYISCISLGIINSANPVFKQVLLAVFFFNMEGLIGIPLELVDMNESRQKKNTKKISLINITGHVVNISLNNFEKENQKKKEFRINIYNIVNSVNNVEKFCHCTSASVKSFDTCEKCYTWQKRKHQRHFRGKR